MEAVGRKHRERSLRDPALIARTTPDYTVGCKRILPSNDWYPALRRDNVELVTSGVREVREHSILTEDGRELEVDALVFGTGFHVVDMPVGRLVRGRDGRALADVWDGSPHAHMGCTVPGFPNLFILLGPNTGLGHNSMVYMIESQIAYVMDALRDDGRCGHPRGPSGGRGRLQHGGAATHAGHGLELGLHELVPGRQGQQPDAVAGLDVAVPAPHSALRPGRVRDRMRIVITGRRGIGTARRLRRRGAQVVGLTCTERRRPRRARPASVDAAVAAARQIGWTMIDRPCDRARATTTARSSWRTGRGDAIGGPDRTLNRSTPW